MTYLLIIGIILILLAIGNLLTFYLQEVFIFRPQKLPKDFTFDFSYEFVERFIGSDKHGFLNLLWFRKENKLSDKGVIVYYHGNANNLARWGKIYEDFAHLGYDMIIYDYRGYGKSTGKRSEKLFYADAQKIYDLAKENYEEECIIVYGRSMGSGMATFVALNNEPKKLLLETPYSSIPNLFYVYYPFLPRLFTFKYTFHNDKRVPNIKCPIYIFHGTKDKLIPLKCAARLKPLLKKSDEFFIIPKAGHGNLIDFPEFIHKRDKLLK